MPQKKMFLVDEHGKRTAIILDLTEYRRLLEQIEELEDLKAFDAAKASGGNAIPLEQAVEEINRRRSNSRARPTRSHAK